MCDVPCFVSISSCVDVFDVVHEGAVHDAEPARSRIVSGEIPVAGVFRTALGEIFAGLEDHCEVRAHTLGLQPGGDCATEIRVGDRLVDRAHAVGHLFRWTGELSFRIFVALLEQREVAAFAQQVDGRFECDELFQTGHVDAVTVGIFDRRRGRGDDDLLRREPVEDRQNRVSERVAAYDRVVERHERVRTGPDQPVGHVVNVHVELLPARGVGDERAEFRVLDRDLAEPDGVTLLAGDAVQRIEQSVKTRLRGVRDVGEKRVFKIFPGFAQHGGHEFAPECAPFTMNVGIVRAREVDAFKDAPPQRFRVEAGTEFDVAVSTDDKHFSRRKFRDFRSRAVERRLDRGTLGTHNRDFIVEIEVTGPDSRRVADRESGAVPEHAAERERAVEIAARFAQHCGEVDENALRPRGECIDLEDIQFVGQYAPFTWEGCVVKLADKVAYLGRDVEDAVNLGFLDEGKLAELKRLFTGGGDAVNTTVIMHDIIVDVCRHSSPEEGIVISPEYYKKLSAVKAFNYENIYTNARFSAFQKYASLIIETLFEGLYSLWRDGQTFGELERYAKIYPELGSAFITWLLKYCDADVLPVGRRADMAHLISSSRNVVVLW